MLLKTQLGIATLLLFGVLGLFLFAKEFLHDQQVHPALCAVTIMAVRENPCREVYDCQHQSFLQCTSLLSPCAEYVHGDFGNYRCCESESNESRFCHVKIGTCPEYDISITFLDENIYETRACPISDPKCVAIGARECWWDARKKALHWKAPEFLKGCVIAFTKIMLFLVVVLLKMGILDELLLYF